MSALLRWVITIPLVILTILFCAVHADAVTLKFSPLLDDLTVPLFVPVVAFLFIGFIWGAVINWLNSAPKRRKTHELKKEIKALNKEITALKEQIAGEKARSHPAQINKTGERNFDLLTSAK